VLNAATALPDRFAIPDRDRVASGHRTDVVLVLLDGDPTTTSRTRNIVTTWKNGYRSSVDNSRTEGSWLTHSA
jgi:hypothetical protein